MTLRPDASNSRLFGLSWMTRLTGTRAARPRLLSRVLLVVGATVVIGTIIATASLVVHARSEASRSLVRRAELTAQIAARSMSEALWNLDAKEALGLLQALAYDPDFVVARIHEQNGRVFSEFSLGSDVKRSADLTTRRPIYHVDTRGRQALGELEIGWSSQRSEAELTDYIRALVFAATLFVVVIGVVLGLMMRQIVGPIGALTQSMTDLHRGNVDIDVPATDRTDEIGDMARSLAVLREHEIELHRLYEQKSAYLETIEMKVAERTAELQSALDHLRLTQDELVRSEKLAALGGMVAAVAHEVNTPIGNALTLSSTIRDRVEKIDAMIEGGRLSRSALAKNLEDLRSSSVLTTRNLERAADLVHSFKQVAVDQTSARRRQFDLATTMSDLVDSVLPSHRGRPIKVVLDVPSGILVDGYPGSLAHVVVNLIENAYRHAFEADESGTITLRAETAGDRVRLLIADDGRGIPPENIKRIFEPFFSTKLGQGGSGLGLNIVFNQVHGVMGGTISVESVVGVGTTFTLDFPLVGPGVTETREAQTV